ncbi:hypothetical protein XELAEV_18007812mg [Xenopus laevis]|uniref:Uncharacterized protein n=1 Tax=Xenopus laevis TaxID=8355 RepID=A0A974I5F6_XENLA|nr:hypothetical protein XELAEV_18007812mg [Xenopus laevis]
MLKKGLLLPSNNIHFPAVVLITHIITFSVWRKHLHKNIFAKMLPLATGHTKQPRSSIVKLPFGILFRFR